MSDDLLEEAIAALKAEESDVHDGDATLSRLLGEVSSETPAEDLLDEAVLALREQTPPVSTTLEAQTLSRVQTSLAPRPRWGWAPMRNAIAVAAVLGIVWVAPSAWAFSRGAVVRWMTEVGLLTVDEPARDEAPAAPEGDPEQTPSAAPAVATEEVIAPTAEEPVVVAQAVTEALTEARLTEAAPQPERVVPTPRPRRSPARVPAAEPAANPVAPLAPTPADEAPVPEPASDAETLAFTDAHRLHFAGAAPARTLVAWDTFLRTHPHGRYELEARYNRATTLVRLGRLEEARAAMRPFALGQHGGYRQAEAGRLVEALDARIDAPETP